MRAGRDLHVIDGLTVTKMSNEGGDYATVLGTLCVSSGQHSWNVYVNHVEDSNLFIGVTIGGHDLNADPQEMKSRTYYLSNGTIRVAGGRFAGPRGPSLGCGGGVWYCGAGRVQTCRVCWSFSLYARAFLTTTPAPAP